MMFASNEDAAMSRSISIEELHEISAEAIQALPRAVPIKNDGATVGVLMPLPRVSTEYMRKVLADIDAAAARRTPEENAAIDRLLAERGAE
jgi:hypothetical protein